MSRKFRALKAAISSDTAAGPPPRWEEVLRDMAEATYSKPTPEAERLMLHVLRFQGELRLQIDEMSETPHGMTPEEMIKSLAVQTLGEWRGSYYRPTFRRMAATVTSASLVSIIEAVIETAASGARRRWQAEPITELHPQDSSHVVEVDCGWDGRDEVRRYDRGDRVLREALVVVSDFGMTAFTPRSSR
jgi:hypothetical protein